ncbi:MAG: GTPase HflX, partial [Deltaproteobacteria bacterium]|nr:GTPase HflX [Deltaproteobacteria bacterium]
MSRRGDIPCIIVGDNRQIMIPDLTGFRASSARLKGLRLLHTHLKDEDLTRDDLTDLALLRLDLVAAITVTEEGLPGVIHTAYLIPENPQGNYWLFMEPARASEMDLDFLEFIQALEGEFARVQRTRKVASTDRAILIRVETNPTGDGETSLDELRELARSSGVEVFDSIIQY